MQRATIYDLPKDVIGIIVGNLKVTDRTPLRFIKLFAKSVDPPMTIFADVLGRCAKKGYFSLLIWYMTTLKYKSRVPSWLCASAAEGGHLEILQWLMTDRLLSCDLHTPLRAVHKGHLHILRWLYESNPIAPPPMPDSISYTAASNGHFEILKWLHLGERSVGQGYYGPVKCDTDVMSVAAENGRFDIVRWLRSECDMWNKSVCTHAAKFGRLDILQWARESDAVIYYSNPCPWDRETCENAARHGHLEILEWLRSHDRIFGRCPWDKKTCEAAAEEGHLEILKWLREGPLEACPWDEDVCSAAVRSRNVEVLKWLRDPKRSGEGLGPDGPCPWNERLYVYIFGRRALYQSTSKNCLIDTNILDFLYEGGYPWYEMIFEEATKRSNIKVLEWAWNTGKISSWEPVIKMAKGRRKTEVLMWLHQKNLIANTPSINPRRLFQSPQG